MIFRSLPTQIWKRWLHTYDFAKVSLNNRGNELKSIERRSSERCQNVDASENIVVRTENVQLSYQEEQMFERDEQERALDK